jgi:hypothetical protein
MRRAMLWMFLVVTLPTAALANTSAADEYRQLLYSVSPGQFNNGIVTVSFGPSFEVMLRGKGLLTISALITNLSPGCSTSPAVCTFSAGTLKVGTSTNATLYTSTIKSGTVIRKGDEAIIVAYYKPNGSQLDPCGGFARWVVELGPSGNRLVGGSSAVFATPEPGSLGLLGTGVIGFAGMMKRKLKLRA